MKHSALRRAIEQGNLHAVRVAIEHGADIEEADMHGDPGLPLRIACFRGHLAIVHELIQRGADIHAPNAQGSGGPIRMAVKGKHHTVIQLLLAQGAELPEDLTLPKADSAERRKRNDRRLRNAGPPRGMSERRVQRERRMTSVREIELDEVQWENYFAQTLPSARPTPFPTLYDPTDHASLVLGRARD